MEPGLRRGLAFALPVALLMWALIALVIAGIVWLIP